MQNPPSSKSAGAAAKSPPWRDKGTVLRQRLIRAIASYLQNVPLAVIFTPTPEQSINHDPILDSMTKPYFFSTPDSNPGRSRKLHQIPSGQGTGGAFTPPHEQHTEGLWVRCLPGETLSFNHSTFFLPRKSFKRLTGMMEIERHCYAALLAFRQWRQPQLTGSLICACHNIVFPTTNHRKSAWKSNGKGQPFKVWALLDQMQLASFFASVACLLDFNFFATHFVSFSSELIWIVSVVSVVWEAFVTMNGNGMGSRGKEGLKCRSSSIRNRTFSNRRTAFCHSITARQRSGL